LPRLSTARAYTWVELLAFTFDVNVIPGLAKTVFANELDFAVVQLASKYKVTVDDSLVDP
jgi:hypothetical protein